LAAQSERRYDHIDLRPQAVCSRAKTGKCGRQVRTAIVPNLPQRIACHARDHPLEDVGTGTALYGEQVASRYVDAAHSLIRLIAHERRRTSSACRVGVQRAAERELMRPVAATHARAARLELARGREERVAGYNIRACVSPTDPDRLNEEIAEAPAIDRSDRIVAVDRDARDRDAGRDSEIR